MTSLIDPQKQDGYFPLGTENAKGYSAKDHKEFFHFYPWGKVPSTVSNSTPYFLATFSNCLNTISS